MFKKLMTTRVAAFAALLVLAALGAFALPAPALAVPPGMETTFPGGPGPVTFSGKVHADAGLQCPDCHAGIFTKKRGANKITFADHTNGKYCSLCHNGTMAFAVMTNCGNCHGNKSPAAAAGAKPGAKQPAAAAKSAPRAPITVEEKEAALKQLKQEAFSKDGLNTCLACHDETNTYPIFPLFKTKHAVTADPRTPFGDKQCESCHGPGRKHIKADIDDKRNGTIINFGKNVWTPVKDQNEKCLQCHQTHQRIEWKGSTHEFNDVACASCHTIHTARDPVLDRQEQFKVCFSCHASERAEFHHVSRHPVREGQMACSECHNVHGEDGTGLMVKTTLREKCTSCHAEKRGPFLWEHAPAAEDCTLCHKPHGSNQPALLKKRPPQLCQECHSPAGHPSDRYDGARLAGSAYMRAKGCVNCHSAVHGSNHPSGATLLR